jgi:hypothetical protein
LTGRGRRAESAPPPSRFITAAANRGKNMVIGIAQLQPIVALIAGILILILPRLLNYIVAVYLIVIGLFGLGVIR